MIMLDRMGCCQAHMHLSCKLKQCMYGYIMAKNCTKYSLIEQQSVEFFNSVVLCNRVEPVMQTIATVQQEIFENKTQDLESYITIQLPECLSLPNSYEAYIRIGFIFL